MKSLFFIFFYIFFINSNSYADNICSSTLSSANTGTIYDSGGLTGRYRNYENCGFLIQPAGSAASITLTFSQFEVENNYDFLYVYEGTNASAPLIGTFTGTSTLPGSVTATSGRMYLRFVSDYSIRRQGFTASWTSSSTIPQAELKASYNFDDDWDTNNILTDQTGSYNGSPSGSVARVSAGSSGSKGDTCYAAAFTGGDIDITGLPVSTSTGAKTSVSFWMYWDGTNSVMPMGWYKHDLWLYNGAFGFNTWGSDITGISSSGLSLGWHHVAAVFTNGGVSNNKLYIDGIQQSLSLQTGNVNTANATVQSTLKIGGVTVSSGYRFKGLLDNFKIYTGEITQSQVTSDMSESNTCSGGGSATLTLHMDESSWNGTSSEVLDSSGNNLSGTALNEATTDQINPAISGNPGSCNFGTFNGTNQKVSIPYSNILNPDNFTVSFWAKVEGGSGTWRSPITSRRQNSGSTIRQGFNVYAGTNNRWQFWTGTGIADWDVLTGSQVVNNSWTHIAVSFNKISTQNGIHTGTKKLFINGQLSAEQSAQYQPNQADPLIIGGGGDRGNSYFFNGSIDEMQLFNSALNQSQIQTLMAETHTCSNNGGGGSTAATNFNCVENGANGISGKLYTKTTAQSFSFDIVALQDASTIETNFADTADRTINVELVDASSGSCSSYSSLTPSVSQSLIFSASDSGTKSSALMNSTTAYRNVKCRITDNTNSPVVVGCSTDSFAIRPTELSVTSSMTNSSSTGDPKAKTGEDFTLTSTTTSGYNGIPTINNSKIEAHSGAKLSGSISGAFSAASSTTGISTATGSGFTYSEVGSFRFNPEGIYDGSFTTVDQSNDCTNNFSNSPDANGKVGCNFGNITNSDYFGRFTPDHFEITDSKMGSFSDACTGFTYSGQSLGYASNPTLTITAYNSLDAITQNYTRFSTGPDDTYVKLEPDSNFIVTTPTTDTSQIGANGSTLVNLVWTPDTPTLTDNADGSLTFAFGNDSFTYSHETNSQIAPFSATVDLEFTDITDADGIQTQGLPSIIQALGSSIRFGRLNISNAHGSELTPLSMSIYTEYYNGSSFIKNTADSCTVFTPTSDFSISDPADFNCSFSTQTSPVAIGSGSVKASMPNISINNAETELIISDNTAINQGPGAGNTGYVEITSKLANIPWLKYDWDADTFHDNCPSARATFGVYKGNSKQIYFREIY